MQTQIEKAFAHLDALEADRRAALALSEQKAEEAKLIQARQEGFRAAMVLLGAEIPVGNAEADPEEPGRRVAMEMLGGEGSVDNAEADPTEPGRRRARRHIPQLILRELSFSGQA